MVRTRVVRHPARCRLEAAPSARVLRQESAAPYHSRVIDLVARFRAARTDPSLAVLEGLHAIKHALRFGASIDMVAAHDPAALQALALRLAGDVAPALATMTSEVPSAVFDELSPSPPETGVIAIARRRLHDASVLARSSDPAPLVVLDAPSHSGNIGAAIRAAAGAGAVAVLTTGTIDPWNPGALRGSAGLHYAIPVVRVESVPAGDRILIAVDPDGEELRPSSIPRRAVFAFGSERAGLSAPLLARADRRVRIPMQRGVSSLNLATAVAVVLYSWRLAQ